MTDAPRQVFSCPWFTVEAVPATRAASLNAGEPYYRIAQNNGVICIALNEEGDFILVRQYRPSLEKLTIETPAGYVDKGENAVSAARRELYEETGHHFQEIKEIGVGRLLLNRVTSLETMIFATGGRRDPHFVAAEDIDVVIVSPSEMKRMVMDGAFEQLAALSALYLIEKKLGMALF